MSEEYLISPERVEQMVRNVEARRGIKKRPLTAKIKSFRIATYDPKTHKLRPLTYAKRYLIEGERKKKIYQVVFTNKVSMQDVCTGKVVNKRKLSPKCYRLQAMWAIKGAVGSAITLEVFPDRTFILREGL